MFSLLLIGLFGVIGFLCVFEAYRIGSPASVSPFEYILIIWAILISWIIWDEILSIKSYIGIFLIIFAGLYTFFRESIKNREVTIDKPLR